MNDDKRARTEPGTDSPPPGLDAGGHEVAPPSDDPGTNEARDAIQDAFDGLEANRSTETVWDRADRQSEAKPAPEESPSPDR